jgi:hypothetical protein
MSYFEIVPKGFEDKGMSPIERAISIAEYCGKYDCFIPTSEAGVNDLWRLGYDGKFYCLSKNNKFMFSCCKRANIERYLSENVFVEVRKS